ncbi:MAG: hypothetical protein M3Q69_15985, partial [Acidobacteriota bacterium]|nr:hypothetical protein [Acidobacteriota bacterium]
MNGSCGANGRASLPWCRQDGVAIGRILSRHGLMKTITPTMNQSIRRTAVAVLCLLISCAAFADGSEKFFATSAHDRITAQFLVTLAGSEDADFDAIAGAVSRAYGVRIEPFAASGFHGFLTVTTPARARAISADARVVRVDEQRDTDSAGLPRVDSAPPPALQTPPAAAATLQPRSEWTQSPVLWSSGSYGYDGVGNIKSIGDDQYRYDRVGRLVSATAKTVGNTSNAQTFTHDEYGNRRSATTLTASGTYVEEYPVQPLTNQH